MVGAPTQRVFAAPIFISWCQPTKKAAGLSGRGYLTTHNPTGNNSSALPLREKKNMPDRSSWIPLS